MSDVNRAVFSNLKKRNGLFNSLAQYKFLLNTFEHNLAPNAACFDTMDRSKDSHPEVNEWFWLEGTVNWAPGYTRPGRGLQRWAYICFHDGKGITAKYKVKFKGDGHNTASWPKSAKLVWTRPDDVDGPDFQKELELEQEKRKKEEAERVKNAPEITEGRQVITGKVLSAKMKDNGFDIAIKSLIETKSGNRYYGTVPSALLKVFEDYQELVGKVVELRGTVKTAGDHFAIYTRPSNAKVLE